MARMREDEAKVLGSLIARARRAAGRNRSFVAASAGLTDDELRKIERGELIPEMVEFLRICEALSIAPSTLVARLEVELREGPGGRLRPPPPSGPPPRAAGRHWKDAT